MSSLTHLPQLVLFLYCSYLFWPGFFWQIKVIKEKKLWNYLNSCGSIFVDYGVFAYLWGCNFVDASVFSFGKRTNSFKICFRRWFKFGGGGGNTNSNDSTVYFIIYEIHQLIHSTSVLLFMLNLTNYNLVYNALTLDGNNDLYEEYVLPIRRFKLNNSHYWYITYTNLETAFINVSDICMLFLLYS